MMMGKGKVISKELGIMKSSNASFSDTWYMGKKFQICIL